jgi:hypothetical protein
MACVICENIMMEMIECNCGLGFCRDCVCSEDGRWVLMFNHSCEEQLNIQYKQIRKLIAYGIKYNYPDSVREIYKSSMGNTYIRQKLYKYLRTKLRGQRIRFKEITAP